jgi:hypothetical protein
MSNEFNIQIPFHRGDPLAIDAAGLFTPAQAMSFGLAVIESAQKAGVTFADPEKVGGHS